MTNLKSTPHKYQIIRPEIETVIDAMKPGDKLPSERNLARHFSCTTITVRRALSLIEKDGLIERRHGSGTYVAEAEHGASTTSVDAVSNRLGVVVYTESDAYGLKVLQALSEEACERGVDLRLRWSSGFSDEALGQIESLKAEGCCAIILPWFPEHAQADVGSLIAKSPLSVSIAVALPGLERHCFERPDIYGLSLENLIEGLCLYLQSLGYKNIAFLGPNTPSDSILQRKLSSYASYVSRHSMEHLLGLVGSSSEEIDALATKWKPHRGSLAIVSYDDSHAMRFMTAMHKQGLAAPRDYAIVGHNNIEESAYCDPPLTTIYHSYRYVAKWMIRNALALAKGEKDQSENQAGHTLLVRGSCGGAAIGDDLSAELSHLGIRREENDQSAPVELVI